MLYNNVVIQRLRSCCNSFTLKLVPSIVSFSSIWKRFIPDKPSIRVSTSNKQPIVKALLWVKLAVLSYDNILEFPPQAPYNKIYLYCKRRNKRKIRLALFVEDNFASSPFTSCRLSLETISWLILIKQIVIIDTETNPFLGILHSLKHGSEIQFG